MKFGKCPKGGRHRPARRWELRNGKRRTVWQCAKCNTLL